MRVKIKYTRGHTIIIRRLIYIKTELMGAVLVFPPLPVCDLLITL